MNWDNLCIVSPDTGGTKRASTYAKALDCDFAIGFKQRVKANEVSALQIIGNVEGKNVILLRAGGTAKEDIEEFLELSEAKRGVKLEEALHK